MSEPSAKRRKLANTEGGRITDPRFANIQSDPKYRLPGKKQRIKLDKRFTQKFRDDDFTKRAKVDRYGRPVENDAAQQRLREKFDLSEEENSANELDDDLEIQKELERVEKKHDPLREGKDISSSDSDSSSDEESESEAEEEELGLVEKEEVPAGEVSTRIAVVNLDWDNIRAQDLMAVFSSFLPAGGRILKVSVYPSEFGRERMEREELEGPPKEIFSAQNGKDSHVENSDEESEDQENDEDVKASIIKPDDGSEFDSQALRQYQLERLRYFYAVLIFSSKEVAKTIYDAVDGTEYLSTANFFDLRFIPEDMDFSDDKVRDECDRLPIGYQPNEFVTDALQHSKVKLTWDAEDRTRKQAITRAFTGNQKEIEENDLKAYLGSDTSDSEEDAINDKDSTELQDEDVPPAMSRKAAEREKMRALLGLPSEPAKKSKKGEDKPVGNIHITFTSGLSAKAGDEKNRSIFANSPEPEETTAERYVRKEKERKMKRKEKMKAARAGGEMADEDTPAEEAEIGPADSKTDDLGFDDPFFNEALNDTKQTNKIRKEQRLKKRQEREMEEAASAKQRAELELLMADDDAEAAEKSGVAGKGRAVQHFDMNEIEKAEKAKNKKSKHKHKKNTNKEDREKILQNDDFKMQTSDPRLARLFENHEFAIDPTNSQLRQTKGMKELMEETRRRKEKKGHSREDTKQSHGREKEKARTSGGNKTVGNRDEEVRDLVAKLKRKAA